MGILIYVGRGITYYYSFGTDLVVSIKIEIYIYNNMYIYNNFHLYVYMGRERESIFQGKA